MSLRWPLGALAREEERLSLVKKVLAEATLASLLAGLWIASCYLAATLAASFRTQWWETEAWRAWWIALPIGVASLAAGLVVRYSERLGTDRPARILLRSTLALAVAALGLAVQALRPPRLIPDDFFLSYPQLASGPDSVPFALAGTLAIASVLLAVASKLRTPAGSPNCDVSKQTPSSVA